MSFIRHNDDPNGVGCAIALLFGGFAKASEKPHVQQQIYDACKKSGGVPIVDGFNYVTRCDFPCDGNTP